MEKFKPVSPDPAIINEGDQALAKFGHLNEVVDALNKLVPLSGTGTPASHSLVPKFIGQIYINTSGPDIYMATSLTNWVAIYTD